ncbi:ankyrin repeat and SOCS box protein 13-like [Saccostrea cucullata]|uniref:ankyrin repeat and SOCS box protein 13-like n=1 Tax=Saccostrea cuccullata TaxID=36930 RepID=UPI002ED5E632
MGPKSILQFVLKCIFTKTPLEAACKRDQSSIVKDLLEAGGDVKLRSFDTTPLIRACTCGDERKVQQLLEAGASVNQMNDTGFDTPLIVSCGRGHMSIVEKPLDAGADVNLNDIYDTPLTAASQSGHMRIVEKLLEAGAGVNIQDSAGRTPLHKILLFYTETEIPFKLKDNADPTVCDYEELSSISIALIRNKFEIIKQLYSVI